MLSFGEGCQKKYRDGCVVFLSGAVSHVSNIKGLNKGAREHFKFCLFQHLSTNSDSQHVQEQKGIETLWISVCISFISWNEFRNTIFSF